MILGIDPKVDYAFKRLFGSVRNQALLVDLLNAVLDPPAADRVVEVEILNPFNDKEKLDDKLSILDVKARDGLGRQFNVEMQVQPRRRYFRKRILYYWARLHAQQLYESDEYESLRPTISVCFVNDVLYPDTLTHHLRFSLWDRGQGVGFTDDLAMHLLELPKFTLAAEQLTGPLDMWLYFLRHAEGLDVDALPPSLAVGPVRDAIEEVKMLSQNDLERERYEARLKLQRDAMSFIRDLDRDISEAEDRGCQRGLAVGREEGLKKGLLGRIHLAERLLHRPLSAEPELLARSSEDLTTLAEQLEQELMTKRQ